MTIEAREAVLRRAAKKLGLSIQKKEDGYMIADVSTGGTVSGNFPIEFSLTLEQAEAEIKAYSEINPTQ